VRTIKPRSNERESRGSSSCAGDARTNLKRLRLKRGWSQERVAHESELNPSYVSKIERSEREPGVRTVSKLATALGVSAAELFEGIDGR
jgi:transcriptional regulator with XRE-family HTH domain